jgi:tetratricopeptide (TPR) repeat protein
VPPLPLTETQEALIAETVERLLAMPEESSRRSFLLQNPQLQAQSVVLYLASQVPKIARDDVDRALQRANLASWLADLLGDDYCRARSARAMGHPLQLKGKLRESLAEYQKALDIFTKLKLDSEVGITLSSSLQPLILLGNYEESRLREEKARKIFKAQKDGLRLARLDANLGNILHRQDRFEEALVLYRRAEQSLLRFDAADDLAILLNNIAVCYIGLREFPPALETYRRLRAYSEQRNLHLLTVQADYNIAYLHYLQGEFKRAINLYKQTRTFCASAGDPYHAALCDLDQAEIYLHLNLFGECTKFAQESLAQFQSLKLNYEAAKAYTFLGLVACQQTDSGNPLELLGKARELFVSEENWIWPALVDLYRAIVLCRAGSWPDALKAVTASQTVLSHSALKDKAVLAELLRSLLHLELADSAAARYWGESALERIKGSAVGIKYLAEFVLGRVRETQNDLNGANQHYEKAKTALESLADPRQREGIEIPLLKNTDTLYQHFMSVALRLPDPALIRKPRLS